MESFPPPHEKQPELVLASAGDHDIRDPLEQLSRPDQAKLLSIRNACRLRDHDSLVSLATSPLGLVCDEARQEAWPILLGCRDADLSSETNEKSESVDWRSLPEHRAEHQVQLDVDRSFVYYPDNLPSKELDWRRGQLSDLINQVLRRYPLLHYFQGYHDICQVLLLVLGPTLAVPCAARLSLIRIRDFMLPSLSPALLHLNLLPDILNAEDPKLYKHISQTQPFFALAATLTLYAHDVQGYKDIARLFDVLLAKEPVFSVYLFAKIIITRKKELLDIPPDEPEMIHFTLTKLPQNLDLDLLVVDTAKLLEQHPPESLRAWKKISRYSVLKSARTSTEAAKQTLEHGVELFQKQAAQLRMLELQQRAFKTLVRYKRPAGMVGLAFVVGLVSWWMGRNGAGLSLAHRGLLSISRDFVRFMKLNVFRDF